ncbi:hypothetical protein [Bradyrhizobium sp. JR3.5]
MFSINPSPKEECAVFRHKGMARIAAGFAVYGLQTLLVLTLGEGVEIFTLDRAKGLFKLSRRKVAIPPRRRSSPSTHRISATGIHKHGRSWMNIPLQESARHQVSLLVGAAAKFHDSIVCYRSKLDLGMQLILTPPIE